MVVKGAQRRGSKSVNRVWVLAASTGGIAAVTDFLSRVTPQEDLAFIYVQHIDQGQHRQLLRSVERASHWPARSVDYGSTLPGGWVTIPGAEERFDIDDEGLVGIHGDEGWKHPYKPSIDEVAEQVAKFYRARAGMIVFSGMAGDGRRGSRMLVEYGGQVWVQDPASCIAEAMPQTVLETVEVDFVGDIDAIAEKFNRDLLALT